MTKRILILSSNPKGTSALDLDIEKRTTREALKGSEFDIETRGAVRPKDLQQALLEVKPQIVHFCGHGEGTEGIVLMNDGGEINLASTQALTDLFKIFSDRIECIVLNACYSEVQAHAIVKHINYVIGMNRSVLDEAAILFARGGEDRTIKLWNLETAEKQQPHILKGHAGSIWSIAISPDGSKIASASGDYTIKIWDIKTGQMLETLTGHLGEVRTVAFSPDGQMLASAGDDWEVKLWQLDD